MIVVSLIGLAHWRFQADRDPTRLVAEAQADYRAGRFMAAAAKLDRLAKLRAPTPMDRMARALVARALGSDALTELAQIPDDHPLSSEAQLLSGQIEKASGWLRRAEAHFQAALASRPDDVHAHHELAALYNSQERWREMDEQMEALSELSALDFEHLVHWGKTKNGIWNSQTDCEALAKSLKLDPEDRYTRLALSDGLRKLGRLHEAASVLSFLPDADPEARARRALLALELGDARRADELLSSDPGDHPALAKARGQLALFRRDPAGAVRAIQIVLAARPDDFSALAVMASALRMQGNSALAQAYVDAQKRHTDITPLIVQATTPEGRSDPSLPARLGAACEAAGRLAEARGWYRQAIASNPLDSQAQQGLFRVRELQSSRTGRRTRQAQTPGHRWRGAMVYADAFRSDGHSTDVSCLMNSERGVALVRRSCIRWAQAGHRLLQADAGLPDTIPMVDPIMCSSLVAICAVAKPAIRH